MYIQMDDEYLIAMGRIAVEFGELDWLIDSFVIVAVSTDYDVGEIVSGMLDTFDKKLLMTSELVKNKYKSDRQLINRFDSLFARIKKVQADRNKLAHATWLVDPNKTESIIRIRKKRGVEHRDELTVAELRTIANDIVSVNVDFSNFLADVAFG